MEEGQILDPDIDAPIDRTAQKKRALILLTIIFALTGVAMLMPTQSGQHGLMTIGLMLALAPIMTWIYFDSIEREDPVGRGTHTMVFFIGWLTVPIYFLRTRGLVAGLRSIGKSIGLLLLLSVVFLIAGAILRILLGHPQSQY